MGYTVKDRPVSKLSAVTTLSAGDYVMVSKLSCDDKLYYSKKMDFRDMVSCFVDTSTTDLSDYFKQQTSVIANHGTVNGRKWNGVGSYAVITLQPNDGGNCGNSPMPVGAEICGMTTLPDPIWARTGFRMEGWATEPDRSGLKYGQKEKALCFGDYNLYAAWQKTYLSVTFIDGFDGSVLGVQRIEAGYPANEPVIPEHRGCRFGAWSQQFSAITADSTIIGDYDADAQPYQIVIGSSTEYHQAQVSSHSVRVCDNGVPAESFAGICLSTAEYVMDPMLSASRIGNGAFRNSRNAMLSLQSVRFENAREIGSECFMNGPVSLTSLNFPVLSSAGDRAFMGSAVSEISCRELKTLGERAFECSPLALADFPMLQIVPSRAFYGASSLKRAVLPSVLSVMDSAFAPNGISMLNMTSAFVPIVEYIGPRAFRDCGFLREIHAPRAVVVDDAAFKQTFPRAALSSVDMPQLQYVGSECFMNQTGLSAVRFPAIFVGKSSFFGCSSLVSVCLDDAISADSMAFACQRSVPGKIGYLRLGALEHVGDRAFERQERITDVSLPSALYIGDKAFYGCSSLRKIRFSSKNASRIRALPSWPQISSVSVFDLE